MNDEADIRNASAVRQIYSPATLLGVYAAAIRSSADGKLVLTRGIYQPSATPREYAGYYYDTLKGVNDGASVKLRVPSLLRSRLDDNHVYVFRGYVEKRINYSAIELVFTVDDILEKETVPVTEEDMRRFSLLQQKITKGSRDFEALVKESVYRAEPLKIANIYGTSAIVDKDFQRGIGDGAARFAFSDFRCNFSSKTEIIRWLRNLDASGYHAIALVRGGGEGGLEIFNDPDIGDIAVKLNAVLITALGHAVNHTLLDKIADRKFDLPHHYGSSLRQWITEASEEQARSRSRFIEQVKADTEKIYADRIASLVAQIDQTKKDKEEFVRAREESFAAQLKAATEHASKQEESMRTLKETLESTAKLQVEAAVAQVNADVRRLREDLAHRNSLVSRYRWAFFVSAAVAAAGGIAAAIAIIVSH